MSFLTPAAFALAALIPVIVAMYLLKLRRTEQVVSSVYLWRRMVRDVEANAPWQRLRRNLLLILQLLFLAALILALARPFTWAEGAGSQATILILDVSASMAASDVPPSRLDAAKAQAGGLVDGLPDDARVTVITAGDGAQVLVASSQDRRQVHRAIDNAQVSVGGSDLTAALELASAIAARQPETEIVILSDGQVTLPERLPVTYRSPAGEGHVRYLPVGRSGDNQAISTLSLGPAPGGGSMTAFAQVTNYGDASAQRRLALYADGQPVNAYDLEISPDGQRAVVADDLPIDTRVLEARLTGQDALTLDDRAWAVHRSAKPAAVTLVTDGNLFLETGLSLLPGLQVTTVRPADFEEGWKDGRLEDRTTGRLESDDANLPASQLPDPPSLQSPISNLTIFDAYIPITATLPANNLFFIAPPRSTGYFAVTGTVDQPVARLEDNGEPLISYINLAELNVLDAVRVPLPPWARLVIAGDVPGETVPLLFAGEVDGRRLAVLAFDLHRSDLPLQVAFPLLLANLTGWLAPGSAGDLPTHVSPGAAVALSLSPGVESATVTRPDGSMVRVIPEGGQAVFADTVQLGVYEVAWRSPARPGRQARELAEGRSPAPVEGRETDSALFSVNLFSPQESNVQPVESLPVAGTRETEEEKHPQQARREWWRLLGLLALTLLTAEWLIYQRASLARLRSLIKKLAR